MSGVHGAEVQMSKGGWARLMKQQQQQQQQDSFQSKSDANDYQVHSIKYKNIISSKQPQHMTAKIYNTTARTVINAASTSSAASSLSATSPPSILEVAVHDHGEIRSSRLLQIVKRWKTQSGTKQIPRTDRSTTRSPSCSTTRSPSCSMLNFVPLSCITFSSIHLHSDLEDDDDDDDDDGNEIDIASDSCKKNAKIRSPRLYHRPTHKRTMKNTQCKGKERDSPCERAPARRTLSCPKLGSPLSSCTAFPSMDEQEGEELECLQPKQEEDHRVKLKRSSSSPLRRHNLLSKQPSTPKGYLALYVGEERRRFLVKANLLNHPLFSILLDKAKEEFGFDQKGALNIPCDIAFFQHIMFLVESNDPSYKNTDHTSILLHFNSANQLATSVV